MLKKCFPILLAVLAAIVFTAPADAAPKKGSRDAGPVKIGIVDMQRIMRESKVAQRAGAELKRDIDAKRAKLAAKLAEVQKLANELKKPDANMPEKVMREKVENFKHEERELRNLQQDTEEDLKRLQLELQQRFAREVMQIIRNFARSERYTLILDRMAAITAEDTIDVTDRIIRLYDAKK